VDDVAIYCPETSTAHCKLQSFSKRFGFDIIFVLYMANEANPSKCEFLCISNRRAPIHHSYFLNNNLLQSVSSAKYLGVTVDAKLCWSKHLSYVSSKATRILNLLHCNMYYCDAPAKKKAFRALVLPVLDYASAVWNPHTHKNISTLEKIQNRGALWVCGSRYNCHSHTCMVLVV